MGRLQRVAIALLAASVWACHDSKQPPISAVPTAADSADQVLIGTRTLLSTNGIQRGELRADTTFVLDDQTRFDLRKAHVIFTTETGQPQGTMDANRGVYSMRTQVLEGWGDVVVKLVDGRTLRSPHVTYNQIAHEISSDTSYTLTRGGDTQTGIGFKTNQSFFPFKCLRSCGGNFSVQIPSK